MAILNPGEVLPPQVVGGKVKETRVKKVTGKRTGKEVTLLEFEFQDLRLPKPLKDVLGDASPTVGLACENPTRQTMLGQLASTLFGWTDDNPLDTDLFLGQEIDFLMEFDGEYWVIERRSLGPRGHLDDLKK